MSNVRVQQGYAPSDIRVELLTENGRAVATVCLGSRVYPMPGLIVWNGGVYRIGMETSPTPDNNFTRAVYRQEFAVWVDL